MPTLVVRKGLLRNAELIAELDLREVLGPPSLRDAGP